MILKHPSMMLPHQSMGIPRYPRTNSPTDTIRTSLDEESKEQGHIQVYIYVRK